MMLYYCISLFFLLITLIPIYFIIRDTMRKKGRWGINLKTVCCPNCGNKNPKIRKPTSLGQALWGGWTCQKCNCEMDKWGKVIK